MAARTNILVGVREILEQAWGVAGTVTVELASRGMNNETMIVGTPSARYVLRHYRPGWRAQHVAREHAVLRALHAATLPFQVPDPVETVSGGTFAVSPSSELWTLFRWMPGQHPDQRNLTHQREMGRALARLDLALLDLGPDIPHQTPDVPATMASLDEVRQVVGEPLTVLDALSRDNGTAGIRDDLAWVASAAPRILDHYVRLFGELPRQWIHQDFALSNVLTDGETVTGILDFEGTGLDLRAMDLASALGNCVDDLQGEQAGALCRAYGSILNLTPAECGVIPTLLSVRAVVGALLSASRWLNTGTAGELLFRRIRVAAACGRWVTEERGAFGAAIARWISAGSGISDGAS